MINKCLSQKRHLCNNKVFLVELEIHQTKFLTGRNSLMKQARSMEGHATGSMGNLKAHKHRVIKARPDRDNVSNE